MHVQGASQDCKQAHTFGQSTRPQPPTALVDLEGEGAAAARLPGRLWVCLDAVARAHRGVHPAAEAAVGHDRAAGIHAHQREIGLLLQQPRALCSQSSSSRDQCERSGQAERQARQQAVVAQPLGRRTWVGSGRGRCAGRPQLGHRSRHCLISPQRPVPSLPRRLASGQRQLGRSSAALAGPGRPAGAAGSGAGALGRYGCRQAAGCFRHAQLGQALLVG